MTLSYDDLEHGTRSINMSGYAAGSCSVYGASAAGREHGCSGLATRTPCMTLSYDDLGCGTRNLQSRSLFKVESQNHSIEGKLLVGMQPGSAQQMGTLQLGESLTVAAATVRVCHQKPFFLLA